ncbi:MAG: DUF2079 domain-containing protein [Candidatus Micrarchaeia archaeon]
MVCEKECKYLYLIIIAATLSTIFWTAYGVYNYAAFVYTYNDIGREIQSFYLLLYHPSIVNGLQYLVISNHIAPDEVVFVAPIMYLYFSPYTLFFIESFVLSFTAVLLFVITKRLTGSNPFAFVLSLAYLLNPGMQGMLIFEFHEEFLIIPLLLLVFYYYMKINKRFFYLSLVLLLAVMDSAVFPAIALGIGLLYFEIMHNKNLKIRRERLTLAAVILVASLAALLIYSSYAGVLGGAYTDSYVGITTNLKVLPFDGAPIVNLLIGHSASNISEYSHELDTIVFYASPFDVATMVLIILAIAFGVFAFGMTALADPILLTVLIFPWLVQEVALRHIIFGSLFLEYYAYVIGNSIIAAILGYTLIVKTGSKSKRSIINKLRPLAQSAIVPSVLLSIWVIFLLGILIRVPIIPSASNPCINQLNWVIARVPDNASLMAMNFIAAHTANHTYIEEIPRSTADTIYFKPDYVLVDFNKCFQELYTNGAHTQLFYNYTNYFDRYVVNGGYHIAVLNGTAELWALNSSR